MGIAALLRAPFVLISDLFEIITSGEATLEDALAEVRRVRSDGNGDFFKSRGLTITEFEAAIRVLEAGGPRNALSHYGRESRLKDKRRFDATEAVLCRWALDQPSCH